MDDKNGSSSFIPMKDENIDDKPKNKQELKVVSSKTLDFIALSYLHEREDEKIHEIESEGLKKEGSKKTLKRDPSVPKNAVFPSKKNSEKDFMSNHQNQRLVDVTVDQIDDLDFDPAFDQDLKKTKSTSDYLQIYINKVKSVSINDTIDLTEILKTNKLIQKFAVDMDHHEHLSAMHKIIKNKVEKIKSKVFKWPLNESKISQMKQLFNVVSTFTTKGKMMFLDYTPLTKIFRTDYFMMFAYEAIYPSDNETLGYLEVANFQQTLISTFHKLYLLFPMSKQYFIDTSSIHSLDPFMREYYREINRKYYHENVEKPNNFSLFQYVSLLFNKFNLAEFPTYNNAYKPLIFVEILEIVSTAFGYGLFDANESSELLKCMTNVSENIIDSHPHYNELFNTNFEKLKKDTNSSSSKGYETIQDIENEKQPEVETERLKNSDNIWPEIISYYEHQISKIRLYCARIIMNVISLICDQGFYKSVKKGISHQNFQNENDQIFSHGVLNQQIATITFNFLTKQFSTKMWDMSLIDSIHTETDLLIADILNFYSDCKTDFFQKSAEMIKRNIVNYYCEKLDFEVSEEVCDIVANLQGVYRQITHRKITTDEIEIEESIMGFCESLILLMEQKNDQERLETSLELCRRNVPNLIFDFLRFYLSEAYAENDVIRVILRCLACVLKGDYNAQNCLFSQKNLKTFKQIFLLDPLLTTTMLLEVFDGDYSLFYISENTDRCIEDLLKDLIEIFIKTSQSDQPNQIVLLAIDVFNYFILKLKKFEREKKKENKKFDLMISEILLNFIATDIIPVMHSPGEIINDEKLELLDFKSKKLTFKSLDEIIRKTLEKPVNVKIFECKYSYYRIFNEYTRDLYSEKVYNGMRKNFEKFPVIISNLNKNTLALRREVVKEFEQFNIFVNNRLLNCPQEVKFGENFLAKRFIPKDTHIAVNFLLSELEWFQSFFDNNSKKSEEIVSHAKNYLLKGFLPGVYKYIDGVHKLSTSEDESDLTLELFIESEAIVDKMNSIAKKIHLFLNPNSISKVVENFPPNSEKNRLIDRIDYYEQTQRNPTPKKSFKIASVEEMALRGSNSKKEVEGSIEALIENEPVKAKFQKMRSNLKTLLKLFQEFYEENKKYQHMIHVKVHDPDKTVKFKVSMHCFTKKTEDVHEYHSSIPKTAAKNLNLIKQIRKWFQNQKKEFVDNMSTNEIILFLKNNIRIGSRSQGIAEFLINQLFHMNEHIDTNRPDSSFLLNDNYLKYLIFIRKSISWCPEICTAMIKEFASNKEEEKKIVTVTNYETDQENSNKAKVKMDVKMIKVVRGVDVMRRLWKIYLTFLNFIYYKTYQDKMYTHFTRKWKMISELIRTFNGKSSKFREMMNTNEFSVIPNLVSKTPGGQSSLFSETYLVLINFFRNTGIWSNQDNKLVHSDRAGLMDICEDMLVDCVNMTTQNSKRNFSDFYKCNHDIWKGILMRTLDQDAEEMYSLQIYVMVYLTRLIQDYDNEIISILSSTYEIEKLFKRMLTAVKELYVKIKGIQKHNKKEMKYSHNIVDLQKTNVFKYHEICEHGNQVINDPSELLELYKREPKFSQHSLLQFAVQIYIFLKKMASKEKFFSIFLRSKERTAKSYFSMSNKIAQLDSISYAEDHAIFSFLMTIISSVEVYADHLDVKKPWVPSKILTRVYFQKLPECFFATSSMEEIFYSKAPIENSTAKMLHLHNQFFAIKEELASNYTLYKKMGYFSKIFDGDSFTVYNYFLLIISFFLNIIMFAFMTNYTQEEGTINYSDGGFVGVMVLAWILVAFSLLFFVLWCVYRGPTEYKKGKNQRLIDKGKSIESTKFSFKKQLSVLFFDCFLNNFRSSSYFFHFVFTILGIFVDEVFFTLNFIMLMNVSGDISYILHSIVDQFDKICGTLILLALVIYSYSYLIIIGFADSFPESGSATCQNFYSCFLNTIQLGFLPGAGLSDKIDTVSDISLGSTFWSYFFLTVTFFLVVKLILLNVIASIIIDTFKDLRTEYCKKIYENDNICFICNSTRWEIQRESIDFDKHIEKSHGFWNYLFYRLKLSQDKEERMDDTSAFVRKMCLKMNFEWIPHRICLPNNENMKTFTNKDGEEIKTAEEILINHEIEAQVNEERRTEEFEPNEETKNMENEFEETNISEEEDVNPDDKEDNYSLSDSDDEEVDDIQH